MTINGMLSPCPVISGTSPTHSSQGASPMVPVILQRPSPFSAVFYSFPSFCSVFGSTLVSSTNPCHPLPSLPQYVSDLEACYFPNYRCPGYIRIMTDGIFLSCVVSGSCESHVRSYGQTWHQKTWHWISIRTRKECFVVKRTMYLRMRNGTTRVMLDE